MKGTLQNYKMFVTQKIQRTSIQSFQTNADKQNRDTQDSNLDDASNQRSQRQHNIDGSDSLKGGNESTVNPMIKAIA